MAKVLFLVSELKYFVSHRLHLAEAAKAAGFDVYVMTRRDKACKAIEASGLFVIPVEMSRRGLNPFGLIKEVISVARVYLHLKPDVVHHVAIRPVVVGGLAAKLVGMNKIVSAIAGMGYAFTAGRGGWLAYMLRALLRLSMAKGEVIVQNPDDLAFVAQLGVSRDRIRLIAGSGVDTLRFTPRPEPVGVSTVLLASRMLWDKGVGEFVQAARLLSGRARFVLVGEPDTSNPANISHSQLAVWVKEGLVEWWGHRDDMPSTLSEANVVCLPSYREGLPKVLLEAMACGRAIVTTDVTGCRDAVRDGDNGLLVPVKHVEALAIAISKLLEDHTLRRRMGKIGRQRAVNEFSQEYVSKATLETYRQVLES